MTLKLFLRFRYFDCFCIKVRLALFVATVYTDIAVLVATLPVLKEINNKYIYKATCLFTPLKCTHYRWSVTESAQHWNVLFRSDIKIVSKDGMMCRKCSYKYSTIRRYCSYE